MLQEFKEFISRGNVMDLAVGVIIGAAFGAIVTAFVDTIITPILSLITGGLSFAESLFIALDGGDYATYSAAVEAGAAVIGIGVLIDAIFNFLVVALALFLLIKWVNSLQRQEEAAPAAPPEPSAEEKLLAEIRDLLARQ